MNSYLVIFSSKVFSGSRLVEAFTAEEARQTLYAEGFKVSSVIEAGEE